jgi:heme/copper-type cytochrome/quinol oxidase subunit 1
MPRLSQWFIRTALLNLLAGFTFGALLLAHKGVPFYPPLWRLLPAHVELLLVGWTAQLALGVAFWILPRFWQTPRRGNETTAWLAYILINLGVWLVVASVFDGRLAQLAFWGRLSEIGAAVAFAGHIWPRIVSRNG